MPAKWLRGLALLFLILSSSAQADLLSILASKYRVYRDLNGISEMKFGLTSPYFQKIFGGSEASNVVEFFDRHVSKIEWSADCPNGVIARVAVGGDMQVCSEFLRASTPQVLRMSTLIHEARHMEKNHGNWPHVACPTPYTFEIESTPFQFKGHGLPLECDVNEFGGYGVEYAFLRSVVDSCENCSEKMKLDAQLLSDEDRIVRIADHKAALRLIISANLHPSLAADEIRTVLMNRIGSKLPLDQWIAKCESTGDCI